MGQVHGKEGKVKFGANAVASITNIRVNEQVAVADATAMGAGWQDHVVGIPGWTGEVTCRNDPDDTLGQAAATIGAEVTIGFYVQGDGTGKKYRSGTATITSDSVEGQFDGNPTFTFQVQGKGALASETVGS